MEKHDVVAVAAHVKWPGVETAVSAPVCMLDEIAESADVMARKWMLGVETVETVGEVMVAEGEERWNCKWEDWAYRRIHFVVEAVWNEHVVKVPGVSSIGGWCFVRRVAKSSAAGPVEVRAVVETDH